MNWTYEEFAERLNKARVAIPPAFGAISAEQVELAMSDKEIPSQGPIAREKESEAEPTDEQRLLQRIYNSPGVSMPLDLHVELEIYCAYLALRGNDEQY